MDSRDGDEQDSETAKQGVSPVDAEVVTASSVSRPCATEGSDSQERPGSEGHTGTHHRSEEIVRGEHGCCVRGVGYRHV